MWRKQSLRDSACAALAYYQLGRCLMGRRIGRLSFSWTACVYPGPTTLLGPSLTTDLLYFPHHAAPPRPRPAPYNEIRSPLFERLNNHKRRAHTHGKKFYSHFKSASPINSVLDLFRSVLSPIAGNTKLPNRPRPLPPPLMMPRNHPQGPTPSIHEELHTGPHRTWATLVDDSHRPPLVIPQERTLHIHILWVCNFGNLYMRI